MSAWRKPCDRPIVAPKLALLNGRLRDHTRVTLLSEIEAHY